MARKGKYPTPEEAVTNFTSGVSNRGALWESRTTAGADKYREWYSNYFAPSLYPQLPSILTLATREARCRRVWSIVSGAAARYRAAKLRRIAVPVPAVPAAGVAPVPA